MVVLRLTIVFVLQWILWRFKLIWVMYSFQYCMLLFLNTSLSLGKAQLGLTLRHMPFYRILRATLGMCLGNSFNPKRTWKSILLIYFVYTFLTRILFKRMQFVGISTYFGITFSIQTCICYFQHFFSDVDLEPTP